MNNVLYYSNFCDPSKRLLEKIAKSQIKEEVSFICIDRRERGGHGKTMVLLENGQKMLLPPTVTRVPALLLVNRGYHVLFGNDIYRHLEPKEKILNEKATMNNDEPLAFSITEMAGDSDSYSYLDMSSDQMSAKGDGGMRMMHNFVTLDHDDTINTPPEDYIPDKVEDDSIEKLQRERDADVPKPQPRL